MFFSRRATKERYEQNLRRDLSGEMEPDGILNGQGRGILGTLRFGRSSVAHAGCESIAVYNALLRLGLPRPLPEVIRDMEAGGYMRGWGHLGAVPYFTPLLRRYGAETKAISPQRLQSLADRNRLRTGDVFLFSVWNDRKRLWRGLHTFAGVYAPGDEGPWLIFNRFNSDRTGRRYRDLPSVLRNGKYRGAYLVIYTVKKR